MSRFVQHLMVLLAASLIVSSATAQTNWQQQQRARQAAEQARQAQEQARRAEQLRRQQEQARIEAQRRRQQAQTRRPVPPPAANSNDRGTPSAPTTAIRGSPNRNVGTSEQRGFVSSGGIAKLTRPLTQGEIRRGFTGRVTSDGRALVRFQNRIFAVPARGLSSLARRAANQNSAAPRTSQQQNIRLAKTQALALRQIPANQNALVPPGTARQQAFFRNAVARASSAPGRKLMLGQHPRYIHAAMRSRSHYFSIPSEEWGKKEKLLQLAGLNRTEIRKRMFEDYNKIAIDRAIERGDRIFLSTPSDEAGPDSYTKMEIDYLSWRGYILSEDGIEFINENAS